MSLTQRTILYKRTLRPDLRQKSHRRVVERAGRPAGRDWNAAMKTHLIALALLVAIAHPASAQDHLIPDRSAFADPDSYLLKIRHVFAPAFEHDITLRA